MRYFFAMITLAVFLTGCDDTRVYEEYVDFEDGQWIVTNTPEFEFEIKNTAIRYNLLGNVRSSVSYPWSRMFMTYYLKDSLGSELQKSLVSDYFFDAKSGEPLGRSGLGDIYDHRLLLLKDYQFKKPGKYKVKLEQFMRTDTLEGVLAVGLRVEDASKE